MRQHKVCFVVGANSVPADYFGPMEIFTRVQLSNGESPYKVMLCGVTKRVRGEQVSMTFAHSLEDALEADTLIVPGVQDVTQAVPDSVLNVIRQAHANGVRIVSICNGAFVLAATGLLDGLTVTTHWALIPAFQARFPKVATDPKVLFCDHGQILTSAGAVAGLDLTLHLIAKDLGVEAAALTAKMCIMPLMRSGGQAQFIEHESLPGRDGTLQPLLNWIEGNLSQNLTTEKLAEKMAMTSRTLHRHFVKQVGMTPVAYVIACRIRRSKQLLETTRKTVELIAHECGFGTAANFRERFKGEVGLSPSEYRRGFESNI